MISDGRIDPRAIPGSGKFGKRERLVKTKDFRTVYEKGRKVFLGGSALVILENGLGHNRLGFSISKKNFKLAVTRNRIRRLFKEIYRGGKKNIRAGFDMVFIIKRGFDKRSVLKEAETVFSGLVKKQGILNDKAGSDISN